MEKTTVPARIGAIPMRRVLTASAVAVVARSLQLVATFLAVPLLLRYLGPDDFGVWSAVISLLSVSSFIDCGIGGPLTNQIAVAQAEDIDKLSRDLSSAFFALIILSSCLALLFFAVHNAIPWQKIFNLVSAALAVRAGNSVLLLVLCLAAMAPVTCVTYAMRYGLHEGHIHSAWDAVASLIALAGLLLCIRQGSSLGPFILVQAGAPVLAMYLNGFMLTRSPRSYLWPRLRSFDAARSIKLFKAGFPFFLVNLMMFLGFSSDTLVAIRILGPEAAAQVSIVFKAIAAYQAIIMLILRPFWPSCQVALAARDMPALRRTLGTGLLLAIGISLSGSAMTLIFGDMAIHAWVGDSISLPPGLLLGMAAWLPVFGTGMALSSLLSTSDLIGWQTGITIVSAIAALGLKSVGGIYFGAPGILLGTCTAYAVFALLPYIVVALWHIRRLAAAWEGK